MPFLATSLVPTSPNLISPRPKHAAGPWAKAPPSFVNLRPSKSLLSDWKLATRRRLHRKFVSGIFAATTQAVFAIGVASGASAADLPVKTKPKQVVDTPFFLFVDNRLTYAYVYHATDAGYFSPKPGGGYNGNTDMNVVAFTHFDVWQYGTNFFTILASKAGHNDPAAPCTNAGVITSGFGPGGTVAADCAGATDFYGILRSTFGFNQIFDTKAFTVGPLHNVSLEVGADVDSQNSYFASAARKEFIGLQFAFDLPYGGYFNVAPLYKMEQGHNGFTQCNSVYAAPFPACNIDGNTNFQNTWALELNYAMDLGFLPESAQFFMISGRFGFYGPKGPMQGIAGLELTKTEMNFEPIRLTFDAGKALWGKRYSHEIDYWVAYRYWKNQYGDNDQSAPFVCTVAGVSTNSCTASTFATGVTVKF